VQNHQALPDSGTSAYYQARARLPVERLKQAHEHLSLKLASRPNAADLWQAHRVKVIDGTGLSMPDTSANQKAYPQPVAQKAGCGFRVAKLVGCFCLASGALLHWVQGTLKDHDFRLFQGLLTTFRKGEIVLADRGFCSYGNLAALLQQGVGAVMRIHHFRKLDWRAARRLGQLNFRRWAVELFFRDIKITLGMDLLRCQTPAMVQKEIAMHAIAYNLIRALMQDIAQSYQIQLSRLSFKGTVDALRQWSELFQTSQVHPGRAQKIRRWFYYTIATDTLIARPNRSEPRAVKRRPKNFRLLT
jgi:hypothetical protein